MYEKENFLIENFMGEIKNTHDLFPCYYKEDEEKVMEYGGKLKYHYDWNWLMPVIDAIKCVDVDKYTLLDAIDDALICIDIEETWGRVVKFIEWHNDEKK